MISDELVSSNDLVCETSGVIGARSLKESFEVRYPQFVKLLTFRKVLMANQMRKEEDLCGDFCVGNIPWPN